MCRRDTCWAFRHLLGVYGHGNDDNLFGGINHHLLVGGDGYGTQNITAYAQKVAA